MAVKNLLVVRESDQLIVLSEHAVAAVALHRCHAANNSCGDCVALQDPYCAWDIKSNTCRPFRPGQAEQLQNVNIGYHPQCPVPIVETSTTTTSTTSASTTTTAKDTTMPDTTDDEIFDTTCPSCICDCTSDLIVPATSTSAIANDEFVDLLDIYNATDLEKGVFQDASFLEIRNSLGVIKRQEKELNDFYDDDNELLENEGIKKEEEGKVFMGKIILDLCFMLFKGPKFLLLLTLPEAVNLMDIQKRL